MPHLPPRHTTHIPRGYIRERHPRSHAARSSSWPAHERPVLLDDATTRRADAPHRPRVRWFSRRRRRWPASPRWSRATGSRRPTSAAGGPTGCATRSRGCAGGRTGAASRRPCLRARNACVDERWWGDHPGGRNPAEGRTGRAKELRAARTEGADELEHGAQGVAQQQQRGGQPFGNQKPSQPPDDVKQEREAVDRPGQRQLGLRRPDREAQPCRPSRGLGRRFSPRERGGGAFVAALH